METQKTLNSQNSLENEEWSLRNQSSCPQTVLQSYGHQGGMVRTKKNRNIYQWNKVESPKINLHTCEHVGFDKGSKNIPWRKDSLLHKLCWENWIAIHKKIKHKNHYNIVK